MKGLSTESLLLKSSHEECISLRLPKMWSELTQEEAWLALRLLSRRDIDSAAVPVRAMLELNYIKILGRDKKTGDRLCQNKLGCLFILTALVAGYISRPLNFLTSAPKRPWRPERFGKLRPRDAELQDMTFGQWLIAENTMQGVISSGNFALLDALTPYIFIGVRDTKPATLKEEERFAVFLWLSGLRALLSRRYPEYYRPAQSESAELPMNAVNLQESTDAQIRILTKGDITKENEVLEANMYRALAELNARAREFREMQAISKK